ncbi:MAG: amidohydrolase family protein [Deltaproteobacteria bacterium]|nr:amidohydrolase family protein [Deltaproteobacteria bacterium]
MKTSEFYVGFPPLSDPSDIVQALLNDPPDVRWRVVRQLFRIDERRDREDLIQSLQPYLYEAEDFRVKFRIILALQALHRPLEVKNYRLVKGKGAFKPAEVETFGAEKIGESAMPNFFPMVDFHIHPKTPDLKFFSDMHEAGVTHGVILATDTDPADVDRPEIRNSLKEAFSRTTQSSRIPFESILKHIKASLHSPTHVSNQDVADWVRDYPDILVGFGSVNLSKDREYVERTLEALERMNMRGIKLLPQTQFFSPSNNDHMAVVLDYCRRTGSIILSHSGCGTGPFEIPELSQNANPNLWEPLLAKYPDVPLVLAHLGSYSKEIPGLWLFEALQLGKKYRNVYADLASVEWLLDRENVVQEIRKTIGFNRILFGSNYPYSLASDVSLAYIISGIKTNTNLTPKEKRKVLGENAARLLGFA